MSMSLYATNAGLRIEASVNLDSFSGAGAVVFPRLHFQVKLTINEETGRNLPGLVQAFSFGVLTGELVVGSEKVADIRIYSLNSKRLGEQDYPTSKVRL